VQIYRGIEIATAKPTMEERRGIPHHLIDYVDPNVNYTAADWARDATEKIVEIEGRKKFRFSSGDRILSQNVNAAAVRCSVDRQFDP
jgi:tRNA dimethylallyltransferase